MTTTDKLPLDEIDDGIRDLVIALNEGGFETTGSCMGGLDHAFELPTVTFKATTDTEQTRRELTKWLIEHGVFGFTVSVLYYHQSSFEPEAYSHIRLELWNAEKLETWKKDEPKKTENEKVIEFLEAGEDLTASLPEWKRGVLEASSQSSNPEPRAEKEEVRRSTLTGFTPGDTLILDEASLARLSERDRVHYYSELGYKSEKPVLFTFLCYHVPQYGHCMLVHMDTGKIEVMRHPDNFRLATEEEC